ncbi:MAG: DUF4169 family protein [Bradyrhizobium sp.]|nr:DUF4169 family protein [Bradyrhizobium sp.]
MGEVVNLKRFRKRLERERSAREAGVKRARFGRSKPERTRDEKRNERASEFLDQHRIDGEDAS